MDQQAGEFPPVSYVMPVLNEEAHLADAVGTILAQDYPGEQEIVLALGASTDRTDQVAAELAARDERITLVRNPASHIPIGINQAIRASRHPIVIRVDAHSGLPSHYTKVMVEALRRTGASVVGGIMRAEGRTPFQRAVARAYNSPFGLGGGVYHGSAKEGPADSAYLGVFDRAIFDVVGGYDETLLRCEDWDLSSRILASGGLVWLVPDVHVAYWPRDNAAQLRRQMFATGAWRGHFVRRQGRTPWKYLAPPALVLALGIGAASGALLASGRMRGPARGLAAVAASGPLVYLAGLAAVSPRLGGQRVGDLARNVGALATMHISWGAGFLRGFALGARGVLDRSRLTPTR